jgi:stearoyl-CoA desaturase (delta-9 desaturase)
LHALILASNSVCIERVKTTHRREGNDFMSLLEFLSHGLLRYSWWQILLAVLISTHVTIVCMTVYLHRCQAHRSLELHLTVSHTFRFWIWKVIFEGSELYTAEARNEETLRKFSHGTPTDWMKRNVYARYPNLGISLLMVIDVALFGIVGVSVWAVQMIWIPFWAGGVVNGCAHFWGYRNFGPADKSTNLFPLGILIGGEELHNNHHAYATSAKLSNKWYEFDIGWMYICILSSLGLARVKRVGKRLVWALQISVDERINLMPVGTRAEVWRRSKAVVR